MPQKKIQEESGTRRPGTPESLPWSLETARCGYKINMAAIEEEKIDVVVKIKQKHGKKDEPLILLCNLPASVTFQ